MRVSEKIQIVGGGFSGLVQAFYLVEKGFKPVIVEKEDCLGGLLGSHRQRSFLVEQAAGAFLANGELERVSKVIGVPLISTQKKASKKFIYRHGKKCRQPLSLRELTPLFGFFLKGGVRGAIRGLRSGETLKQWGRRCLGEAATRFVLEPAMQGVFAVSSDQLDADLVLRSFTKRSKKGRLRGSVAPRGGMGEWIKQMKLYLHSRGCEFVMNHEVRQLDHRCVFWAVDLASLKKISKRQGERIPPEIQKTRTTSLSSVTLMFEDQNPGQEGFGCLFPGGLGFYALGVLFNHNIFEGRVKGGVSETWILGDQVMDFSGMSEKALVRYVLSDRYQLTGVWTQPQSFKIFQWRDRIPVYDKYLKDFIKTLDREERKDFFIGNYLGQLGLSEILIRARANAEKVKEVHFD